MKVRCKNCGEEFETTCWNIETPVVCKCSTVFFYGTYIVVNKEASGRKFGKRECYYIETDYRNCYLPEDKIADSDIPILICGYSGELLIQRKLVWVAVAITDKSYGGPEEGGWWYDTQVVLERHRCYDTSSVTVELYHLLRKYKGKQGEYPVDSVLSEGKLEIIVSDEIPRDFPKTKPYYE